MLTISDIISIINIIYEIEDSGSNYLKLINKNNFKKIVKSISELTFLVEYINFNFCELSKEEQEKNAENLIRLLDNCSKWNAHGIYVYLLSQSNFETSKNLQSNIINFLFSNKRTAPFKNIIKKLLLRKDIYTERTEDHQIALLFEGARQFLQGRSAYDKLPVTNQLITNILSFSLRTNSNIDYFPLILSEPQGKQLREIDNLGAIHSDFLEIATLYNLNIPYDTQTYKNLCKYIEDVERYLVQDNIQVFKESMSKMKIVTKSNDLFNNETLLNNDYPSLTDNFNNLCFQCLKEIRSNLTNQEIYNITVDNNFGISGSILFLLNENFNKNIDYSKLYSKFISGYIDACNYYITNASPEVLKNIAIKKITTIVYESKIPIRQTKSLLEEYFENGISDSITEFRKNYLYHKLITSNTQNELFCDPRKAESSFMKSKSSFGDDYDAMTYTNIPGSLDNEPFLRMGAQINTTNGSVSVQSALILYIENIVEKTNDIFIKTLKRRFEPNIDTSLLYICNLRTSGKITEVEANAEAIKVKALLESVDKYKSLGHEVVIMPANRGFLAPEMRNQDGANQKCLNIENVIEEITKIMLNNGQDFYLSERVRHKLFKNCQNIKHEIKRWIRSAIDDLNFNTIEISLSERQQLATHFFKYTLTDQLLKKLNPHKITTPCKDCIDRGMVHYTYYTIINLIKNFNEKVANDKTDEKSESKEKYKLDKQIGEILKKELHSGALLVKARIVNEENFELLVHTLKGFINGKTFERFSDYDFPILRRWVEKNNIRKYIKNLSSNELKNIVEIDEAESENRLKFLLPSSTKLSDFTKYIPKAIETVESASSTTKVIYDNFVSFIKSDDKLNYLTLYSKIFSKNTMVDESSSSKLKKSS